MSHDLDVVLAPDVDYYDYFVDDYYLHEIPIFNKRFKINSVDLSHE